MALTLLSGTILSDLVLIYWNGCILLILGNLALLNGTIPWRVVIYYYSFTLLFCRFVLVVAVNSELRPRYCFVTWWLLVWLYLIVLCVHALFSPSTPLPFVLVRICLSLSHSLWLKYYLLALLALVLMNLSPCWRSPTQVLCCS